MKGYKALDKDMRAINGNDMQFKLGKWYSVEGEVVPCCNGFHFCGRIEDLNRYYDIAESRIFEVEAEGDIERDVPQIAAQKIRLVRELTEQEINDYYKKNWRSLVTKSDYHIRQAVARQGYGLEELVYDKSYEVREAVAEQGYGLDILVKDECWFVRKAVARQGYGLDILINDAEAGIRCAVAEQGYGLEILAMDKNSDVRRVAEELLRKGIM